MRAFAQLDIAVDAQCSTQRAGSGQQEVGTALAADRAQAHPLVAEIVALPDRKTHALDPGLFDETRSQRNRQLIRVTDAVAADKPVFAEQLHKTEVGVRAIEVREQALVPIRRPDVKQARLQRLVHVAAEKPGIPLEHHPAVERKGRHAPRQIRRRPRRLIGEPVLAQIER